MIDARRVIIHGRVQGVGFRAWMVEAATHLGLSGWVRNRNDGTIEAVFRGEELVLGTMFESCKIGPPSARVERIESFTWKEETTGLFTARPTV